MSESKRLQCVIPIPATALRHDGPHCHSLDPQAAFHYCETRFVAHIKHVVKSGLRVPLDVKTAATFANCRAVREMLRPIVAHK